MQNKDLNQIENKAEDLEKTLTRNSIWDRFSDVFYYKVDINDQISISVLDVIILITVIVIASVVLNTLYKIITKRLPEANKNKFSVFYGYFKWLIYIIIFLIAMHSVGISVTAFFAASAALLIGIGLALQTLFQDTISGIFILVDQSVHVGDIIEIDGKVGRIIEIKLRTTRAVTIENKVLVIPNHLYLTHSLYNWTQNGILTRESISVGVAYGSDIDLVKELLIQATQNIKGVLKEPKPMVLFNDFAESALEFKIIFSVNNSFLACVPKSDVRSKIYELFKAKGIEIPFPQREVFIKETKS